MCVAADATGAVARMRGRAARGCAGRGGGQDAGRPHLVGFWPVAEMRADFCRLTFAETGESSDKFLTMCREGFWGLAWVRGPLVSEEESRATVPFSHLFQAHPDLSMRRASYARLENRCSIPVPSVRLRTSECGVMTRGAADQPRTPSLSRLRAPCGRTSRTTTARTAGSRG